MRRKALLVGLMAAMMAVNPMIRTTNVYGAEQTQSSRWEGSDNTWRVSDNNGSYLKNCWFQDDITGQWYLLGAGDDNTIMFSGLVTDQSTGKTYLLNTEHDGAYGRMLTASGTYTVNGKKIYIEFNQNHDGAFGAITSGLDAVRSTGVEEKQLPSIPSDSHPASSSTFTPIQHSWEGKSNSELTEDEWNEKYFGGSDLGDGTGARIQLMH